MSGWISAAAILVAQAAMVPADTAVAPFVGSWACKGHFVASGRPLAATVSIRPGAVPGTLAVDHRDVPPGAYHATELWSLSATGVRVAIADGSGMRRFEGLAEAGRIMFARTSSGNVVEQFVYTPTDAMLTIDWSHRGSGGALELGDTLTCRRDGSGS